MTKFSCKEELSVTANLYVFLVISYSPTWISVGLLQKVSIESCPVQGPLAAIEN